MKYTLSAILAMGLTFPVLADPTPALEKEACKGKGAFVETHNVGSGFGILCKNGSAIYAQGSGDSITSSSGLWKKNSAGYVVILWRSGGNCWLPQASRWCEDSDKALFK
jgi:hypothetical protein